MLFTMYQQQLHPLQGLEVCAGLVLVLGAVPTAARMRPYYCSALYGGGACLALRMCFDRCCRASAQKPDLAADFEGCHGWLQRPHSDTQDDGTAFMVL
jgi:hypothetical protein